MEWGIAWSISISFYILLDFLLLIGAISQLWKLHLLYDSPIGVSYYRSRSKMHFYQAMSTRGCGCILISLVVRTRFALLSNRLFHLLDYSLGRYGSSRCTYMERREREREKERERERERERETSRGERHTLTYTPTLSPILFSLNVHSHCQSVTFSWWSFSRGVHCFFASHTRQFSFFGSLFIGK
jgi:hypothetical protein